MHFRFCLSVLIVFISVKLSYGIILTEVMFDPDGNDNSDEFIELYNNSMFPLNITGWMISDGEGIDQFEVVDQSLFVLPNQFILILDPEYFSMGSNIYEGIIPDNALVITINNSTIGSRGLSNSAPETILLLNSTGDTVLQYTYSVDNDEGHSDEKVILNSNDGAENWRNSLIIHGTPGASNSVTPLDFDYGMSQFYSTPHIPNPNEILTLSVQVKNFGMNIFADSLNLYEVNLTLNDSALLHSWYIDGIAIGDSVDFEYLLTSSEYLQLFHAILTTADDRLTNNLAYLNVNQTDTEGSVVFNEIMYSPNANLAEWVELFNTTSHTISLSGWSLADGNGIIDTSDRAFISDISISANSYAILAADSTVFMYSMPDETPAYIWNASLPSFNNSGDSLVLFNPNNETIDRVDYRPSWGGGLTGISLERISLASLTNDHLNWNSSLDSTGSTPGRQNSRSIVSQINQQNTLILEPNPFSPNDDGYNDILSIRYKLDHVDSRVDIKIFDVRGRQVKTIANNLQAGLSGEHLWDGTDDNHLFLPTGIYVVYLEASGNANLRVQSVKRPVGLARTK